MAIISSNREIIKESKKMYLNARDIGKKEIYSENNI